MFQIMYLNMHACLEKLRVTADENFTQDQSTRGPVTMIVGPADVGKTTLCKILLNYAVRQGRRPIYVDLDVGQGDISICGTMGKELQKYCYTCFLYLIISTSSVIINNLIESKVGHHFFAGSVLVERTASVEEGFSQEAPLVFSFGHATPRTNHTLYNILVSRMAVIVHEKMACNRKGMN